FSDGLAGSGEDDADGVELGACARCGAPSPSEVCAFCRLVERAGGVPQPVVPGAGVDPHPDRGDGGNDDSSVMVPLGRRRGDDADLGSDART
ncbi:MAG: hypothetical protein ACHQDC_03535, partial [Acidimicrobiales bacterium]